MADQKIDGVLGASADHPPPATVVTSEESKRYSDLVGAEIRGSLGAIGARAPEILWHYTSAQGLVGIIETDSIWATQVSCLNDATELRYASQVALVAFHRKRAQRDDWTADDNFLFDKITNSLSVDPAPTSPWFVSSLSELGDDLSQWRAYGGGEGGYCIAFHGPSLVNAGVPRGVYLLRVNYDQASHERTAARLADHTLNLFREGLAARSDVSREEWAEAFLTHWGEAVSYIGP